MIDPHSPIVSPSSSAAAEEQKMATPIQNQTSDSPLMLQSIKLLEFLNFDINSYDFHVFAIWSLILIESTY